MEDLEPKFCHYGAHLNRLQACSKNPEASVAFIASTSRLLHRDLSRQKMPNASPHSGLRRAESYLAFPGQLSQTAKML